MTFVSNTEAWAVGDRGYIARWDGREWHQVESPIEGALTGVSFVSASDGWAVSDNAEILHWDGNEWIVAQSFELRDPGPGAGSRILQDIGFANPSYGSAVGYTSFEGGTILLAIHWDGETWQRARLDQLPYLGESFGFNAIAMLADDDIWAVGTRIIMHFDGTSWQEVPTPAEFFWLYSVSAVSSSNVWAAGIEHRSGHNVGATWHWNGEEWSDAELPSTGWVNSIAMLSRNDGWVGGNELFHWDGNGWKKADKPTVDRDRIADIEISPDKQVWARTEHGAFLHLETSK